MEQDPACGKFSCIIFRIISRNAQKAGRRSAEDTCKDISASAADFLEEPIVVCRASGTCVTPKECKRK